MKLHIVKIVLIETQNMQQTIDAKSTNNAAGRVIKPNGDTSSSLAFLCHIKKLLDGLEHTTFLFTKAKVPCMHMCIWAVTSILRIFEH